MSSSITTSSGTTASIVRVSGTATVGFTIPRTAVPAIAPDKEILDVAAAEEILDRAAAADRAKATLGVVEFLEPDEEI